MSVPDAAGSDRQKNALLAAISLVAALGLLEAAARIAVYHRPPIQGGLDSYAEHDPLLGWRKRPGASFLLATPEYSVRTRINGLGLRDPERGYAAPAGVFRVLALGDSFVEGCAVSLERTVTQVLETSLRRKGCPVQVLNGGTAGYSTDQEYLFYDREGSRYSPEAVLLFFYYNDVRFNAYAGARRPRWSKPVFSVRDGELVLENVPVPLLPPAPARHGDEGRGRGGPSALVDRIGERLRTGAPAAYDRMARWGFWPPRLTEEVPAELKVYKRRQPRELEDAWARTALILAALARDVALHAARFAVVYVPSAMEVSERSWSLTRETYGTDDTLWDRGLVLKRLEGISTTARFPLLDLTAALSASDHGVFGGPYYRLDEHWNSRGHAVAARAVEEFLHGNVWLPCAPPRKE